MDKCFIWIFLSKLLFTVSRSHQPAYAANHVKVLAVEPCSCLNEKGPASQPAANPSRSRQPLGFTNPLPPFACLLCPVSSSVTHSIRSREIFSAFRASVYIWAIRRSHRFSVRADSRSVVVDPGFQSVAVCPRPPVPSPPARNLLFGSAFKGCVRTKKVAF